MNIALAYLGGLSNSSSTATWTGKLHVMRSSDGAITRAVFCQNGVPIWFFFLEVPGSPFHTNATPDRIWNNDQIPWLGACYGSATVVSAGLYNGTPNWAGGTVNFATRLASGLTNPSANAVCNIAPVLPYSAAFGDFLIAANNTAANIGDQGYTPVPIGWACSVGGYVQPYLGTMQDGYFIGNNLTDGASGADNGSTSSWRKFGNWLLPFAHGVTAQMS